MSEERQRKNKLAKITVYASASLLLIFSGSLLVTHLQGNLKSIAGILLGYCSSALFPVAY